VDGPACVLGEADCLDSLLSGSPGGPGGSLPTFCLCLQMEMTVEPDPDYEGSKISVRSGHICIFACDYLPYIKKNSIVFNDMIQ